MNVVSVGVIFHFPKPVCGTGFGPEVVFYRGYPVFDERVSQTIETTRSIYYGASHTVNFGPGVKLHFITA